MTDKDTEPTKTPKIKRTFQGKFAKGQSGNPFGRPKHPKAPKIAITDRKMFLLADSMTDDFTKDDSFRELVKKKDPVGYARIMSQILTHTEKRQERQAQITGEDREEQTIIVQYATEKPEPSVKLTERQQQTNWCKKFTSDNGDLKAQVSELTQAIADNEKVHLEAISTLLGKASNRERLLVKHSSMVELLNREGRQRSDSPEAIWSDIVAAIKEVEQRAREDNAEQLKREHEILNDDDAWSSCD